MCDDSVRAQSGRRTVLQTYERREIVLAQGVEGHESDLQAYEDWRTGMIANIEADATSWRQDQQCMKIYEARRWSRSGRTDEQLGQILLGMLRRTVYRTAMQLLEAELPGNLQISGDRMEARYVNNHQRVIYELRIIQRRQEYKTALETPGLIVIYSGHSRYGRGAVFAQYDGRAPVHGNHWGSGAIDNPDEGIFRMGYPFVAIPFEDIEHHQYDFSPAPVEGDRLPSRRWRHPWSYHPECSGSRRRILLPEALRGRVMISKRSPSNRYWGVRRQGKDHLFLHAGWNETIAAPLDIGATQLRCRTFCHLGCSSRLHYWNIVRKSQYKGFERSRPPSQGLAYFTTAPSTKKSLYWLVYLMSYDQPNLTEAHFYETHEYAKQTANRRLRTERAGFQIY